MGELIPRIGQPICSLFASKTTYLADKKQTGLKQIQLTFIFQLVRRLGSACCREKYEPPSAVEPILMDGLGTYLVILSTRHTLVSFFILMDSTQNYVNRRVHQDAKKKHQNMAESTKTIQKSTMLCQASSPRRWGKKDRI